MATRNTVLQNALILFVFALAIMAETAFSEGCAWNGGCPDVNECCEMSSQCGNTSRHCGFWCISGPCKIDPEPKSKYLGLNAGPRALIESVVTPKFFNSIMYKDGVNCSAKGFYTHKAFITAVKSFGAYKGKIAKREIAAILAHFSFGSKSFCEKEETVREKYCSVSKEYPCESGKDYYGRGPLLTSWNEYYGAAGESLGLPLLKDPDMVARCPEVAFKFAMWFWNRYVRPTTSLGFAETTKRLNRKECIGSYPEEEVESRADRYLEFCKLFGVTRGENYYCMS